MADCAKTNKSKKECLLIIAESNVK